MDSSVIASGLITIVLFVIAMFVRKGKLLFLLAGYNSLSKEEKEKMNTVLFRKTSSNMLLLIDLFAFIATLYFLIKFPKWLLYLFCIVIVIWIVLLIKKNNSIFK